MWCWTQKIFVHTRLFISPQVSFCRNQEDKQKFWTATHIIEYHGTKKCTSIKSTYFTILIPNHPAWRLRVKVQPWGVIGEKLLFMWSRGQLGKTGRNLSFLSRVRVWDLVKVWFRILARVRVWVKVRSGSEIRAQGL